MDMEEKKLETNTEQNLPVQELPADIPAEVRQKLAEDLNEEATEDLKQDMREAEREEANDEEVKANPEMLTKSRLLKLLIKKQYVKLREVTEEEQPADLAELLEELDVQGLQTILAQKPSSQEGGRLVLDYAWYYAAVVPADEPVPDSGRCRVLFEGFDLPEEANIMSLSPEETGRRALVLRLTLGGDAYMTLRKCSAKLIFFEYSGLGLPEEAVLQDEDGNNFVYTITAGVVERRAVDILYSDGDLCIAAFSSDADGLREGNQVIVSGQEIDKGKVKA